VRDMGASAQEDVPENEVHERLLERLRG
jgi:hypothetical protein